MEPTPRDRAGPEIARFRPRRLRPDKEGAGVLRSPGPAQDGDTRAQSVPARGEWPRALLSAPRSRRPPSPGVALAVCTPRPCGPRFVRPRVLCTGSARPLALRARRPRAVRARRTVSPGTPRGGATGPGRASSGPWAFSSAADDFLPAECAGCSAGASLLSSSGSPDNWFYSLKENNASGAGRLQCAAGRTSAKLRWGPHLTQPASRVIPATLRARPDLALTRALGLLELWSL